MYNLNLYFEPNVYLIGKQIVVRDQLQKFLDNNDCSGWTSDAPSSGEELAEIGGRTCYMSFTKPRPGGNKTYIENILKVQHGSVTEHSVYTLIIEGISRSLSHELVRHRQGMSPSQLSQRYVDESNVSFVVPPAIAYEVKIAYNPIAHKYMSGDVESSEIGRKWLLLNEKALNDYKELTDYLSKRISGTDTTEKRKIARQTARSVLPNCTETKIQLTGNARAWRNFIELRASRHADTEIRVLANKVWGILVGESPNLFSDYQKVELEDGTFELTTQFRKV